MVQERKNKGKRQSDHAKASADKRQRYEVNGTWHLLSADNHTAGEDHLVHTATVDETQLEPSTETQQNNTDNILTDEPTTKERVSTMEQLVPVKP